ncbi:MAG: 23S rRNA (uracil(1939)-C(5))-methyltransferase RlmD [Bacteroidales bacterium]|nr:23S rRNA (uracil(1939)-C(5))-methyltransferase RlmD [Bacteroidales bacterium]
MSRKNKKNPLLEGIEITAYAAEGKSLARVNDKVVFVPFAAVGDVVDIQVLKSRSSYAEGTIARMIKPSPVRVEPVCEHFGVCGGCKWQHIPYEEQLKFKQQQVVDALTRIGKVELPECSPIDGSKQTQFYRNKLEFTFSNKRWLTFEEVAAGVKYDDMNALGFHIPNCFDKVLDIRKCWLQDDISNRIRLDIRQFALDNRLSFYDLRNQVGLLRNMVVRTASTGELMLIVIFGEENPEGIRLVLDHIRETFPQITSLMYVINTKCNDAWSDLPVACWSGKDHIIEEMEDLKFKVGPKSFYQTNSRQAYTLYKYARAFAGLEPGKNSPADPEKLPLVYDLYTGTGTIANFVSRSARKVIGIEYVPEAIEDAKVNSAINGIENTLFYAGDMKDILTTGFIEEHGRPDVIITDPPRAGMHEDVVNAILFAEPKVIVYVSCNPATQARDLQLLDVKYRVTHIQPVDMFPHTQHVENVVRLELK